MRVLEILEIIKFLFSFSMSTHYYNVHSLWVSQLNNLALHTVNKSYTRNGIQRKVRKIKLTLVLQFSMVSTECQRFDVGSIFSREKLLGSKNLLLSLGQVDSRMGLVSTMLYCKALFCFLSKRSLVLTSASLSSVL